MSLPVRKYHRRPDLVGEHPNGDLVQVILIVVFLAAWIGDSFFFHLTDCLRDDVPAVARIVAAATISSLASLLVWLSFRAVFGTVREKPEILRTGVYSLSRHPLYLGSILFILSLAVVTFSLVSLLIWSVIVAYYYFISRYEEKLLKEHFGDAYENYRRDVPMFFPRFRRK